MPTIKETCLPPGFDLAAHLTFEVRPSSGAVVVLSVDAETPLLAQLRKGDELVAAAGRTTVLEIVSRSLWGVARLLTPRCPPSRPRLIPTYARERISIGTSTHCANTF